MAPSIHSAGSSLFRLRSLTPLPVVAIGLTLVLRARGAPGPGGPSVDAALDALGLALAAAGQALRFYTLGWVPEGTSGQDLTLRASVLNTKGPYAWVRNPLYLGNLGITAGLLALAHVPAVWALGLLFFFGEYFFIIRAEERFLRERFGAAFDAYCARVRRWAPWPPDPSEAGALRAGPFDWRRALKKEINPFSAWCAGALALVWWERWARGESSPAATGALAAAALLLAAAAAAVKAWKKGWLGA